MPPKREKNKLPTIIISDLMNLQIVVIQIVLYRIVSCYIRQTKNWLLTLPYGLNGRKDLSLKRLGVVN